MVKLVYDAFLVCSAAGSSVSSGPARQAFADRFSVNDPLRTCDMHQTLIAFLHHSWEVFVFDTRAYRGAYGPWVPITVPWQ